MITRDISHFKQIPETVQWPPIKFDNPEQEIEISEPQQPQHDFQPNTERQQQTQQSITKQYVHVQTTERMAKILNTDILDKTRRTIMYLNKITFSFLTTYSCLFSRRKYHFTRQES